jgi:hypothetical protein
VITSSYNSKSEGLMKKSAFPLFTIAILLCLSACSRIIYIKKTLEPEIIIEKKPVNLVFVNIFDYTLPVYVREKNEVSYHAGVMKLTEGLLSSLSGDDSFKFLRGDSLKKGIGVGLLTTLLPTDSVRDICIRYKANMLLALDSMNIFFDWETIVDRDADGTSRTKNFYLYTRFYFSLYSASGDMINRSQVENSSFYKSRPALSGLITLKPSIANAREKVEKLAFQAGKDYGSKFYPQEVNEPRQIFTGKAFKESNDCLKSGNSNKAVELLEQLVKSPDPKTAERARHNLSVVKECAGVESN